MRRRIGAGGFATVWLCYDEQLDSPVAVKVLADNWAGDHHVRQRFIEEGRFLRKVDSPHVVPVYDFGELDDDRPFLVMAYADQGNLADRLEESTLPPAQALQVIREVGLGLSALHHRDVLHRDVKPANVLFRSVEGAVEGEPEVRAMLGDLGLGKALDMSSRLTMVGGTPAFVAPEQARGERMDARADQYSLGALAYLLLAGRPAYEHGSLHVAGDPPPLEPLATTCPRWWTRWYAARWHPSATTAGPTSSASCRRSRARWRGWLTPGRGRWRRTSRAMTGLNRARRPRRIPRPRPSD